MDRSSHPKHGSERFTKFVKVKVTTKDNLIILYSHKKSEKDKISI